MPCSNEGLCTTVDVSVALALVVMLGWGAEDVDTLGRKGMKFPIAMASRSPAATRVPGWDWRSLKTNLAKMFSFEVTDVLSLIFFL